MRTRWQRALAAFTLIEVTMVAGIIGGAQGSYAGAMDRAKRQVCAHNLDQIYKGLLMLELFEGGRLPQISFYSKEPRKDPHSLLRVLGQDYAGVLTCPCIPEDLKQTGVTYIFNDALGGRSLDSVRNARTTWLCMDMTAVMRSSEDRSQLVGKQPHSGGVNVLYADGHVEWTKTPPKLRAADEPAKEGDEAPAAGESGPPPPSSGPPGTPRIPRIPRSM